VVVVGGGGEMEGLTPAPAAYRGLLCQKLADAARRIQWTYSIFWTFWLEQQFVFQTSTSLFFSANSVRLEELAELALA
jgi:hypothetical protein